MAQLSYDVVIPTHGRSPHLLDAAIESVLRQTVPPQKVIVVVDGNEAEANSLGRRWPDIDVLSELPSSGEAVVRQSGIDAATAEWVCFLDDDDLWSAEKMRITASYLTTHPDCAAVRATYLLFTETASTSSEFSGQFIDLRGDELSVLETQALKHRSRNDFTYLDIQGDSLNLLMERNRGVIGTTCVRRDVLQSLPPVPRGIRPGADHLLFCLVATKTEWHLIEQPLMFYRLHAAQDSRITNPAGALAIIRARREAWRLCGHAVSRPLASYGHTYRREFRTLLWYVLRSGSLIDAANTIRAAFSLLPRGRDRLLFLVPEPVAWRWRRANERLAPPRRSAPRRERPL